ncbi:MAG: hypothetical protein FWH08_05190 [Oscillospiraceae bacterium]|nr:hypothetical protein [Oscillospiraceae bacterium]
MEIIRYVNNQKLNSENMKNYIIESEIIQKTILQVNERLKAVPDKRRIETKDVEIN